MGGRRPHRSESPIASRRKGVSKSPYPERDARATALPTKEYCFEEFDTTQIVLLDVDMQNVL
jgi:hypothetical protein